MTRSSVCILALPFRPLYSNMSRLFFLLFLRSRTLEQSQALFWINQPPFIEDILVSMEGVTKLLKDLNSSKALGPDKLHLIVLRILARELGPVFAILLQQSIDTGEIHKECEIHKEWSHVNISPLQKGR